MDRILTEGRNCGYIGRTGESGVIVDGRDYYRAFYRAAKAARSYILISGWQFDSTVRLLRGADVDVPGAEVRFLAFLNGLCEARNGLRVYILAWDFSYIYMMEREWIQEFIFKWSGNERLFFQFDNRHALGASQHQKYTVIDGAVAFAGGMDICAGRWDDRRHLGANPERADSDGVPYGPYHEVQAYFTGRAVKALADIFVDRWRQNTGSTIELPHPLKGPLLDESVCVPVAAHRLAFSRTHGQTLSSGPVHEIRSLYLDAIRSSRELIFIENQYFSSYAVYRALADRMLSSGPPVEIIIFLPERPQALIESVSLWTTQKRLLMSLSEIAGETGSRLGAYYSVAAATGREEQVYIHSKLLLVDDTFLTIGSANITNRSMGLDTELNIAWDAGLERNSKKFMESVADIRAGLLAEHAGLDPSGYYLRLRERHGLVSFLDSLAAAPGSRIRRHGDLSARKKEEDWLMPVLGSVLFDPEKALIEEDFFEIFSFGLSSVFAKGSVALKRWLEERTRGLL